MTAILITAVQQYAETTRCAYSVAEAAQKLRCSETKIRKIAKRLGVRRIAGPTVAGFIRFDVSPVAVTLPYHR